MSRRNSTLQTDQWDGIIKSVRGAHSPRRRGGKGWSYFFVLVLIVSLVGAGVFAYVQVKLKANSIDIKELASRPSADPMNVLVLGSDSRQDLSPEEQAKYDPEGVDRDTGRRADTIILLHLDEKRDQAVLIHFPRDLLVQLPSGKQGRINGAYQQGPGGVIQTVQRFTGLPIHHYIEVNFTGFRNISNALGGVNVFFERPINDHDSGLVVPKGCVELKGDSALSFVRLRKIDSDFERIERQQLFLRMMMEKVSSAGTLLNPVKMVRLVNVFSENVETDAELGVNDMRKIAWRLRSFEPSRLDMRLVPSAGNRINGVSYVVANKGQTTALFTAMKERKTLPDYGRTGVSAIEPGDVRLTLLNGTDVPGLAKNSVEAFKAKGFDVFAVGDADRRGYTKSVALYKEGYQDRATFVAGHYGAEVKVMPKNFLLDTEVAMILGQDYADGKATPPPPPPPPKNAKPAQKPLVHPC